MEDSAKPLHCRRRSNRPTTFACPGRPREAPRTGHPTRGLARMPRWAGRCAGWLADHLAGWQDGWSAWRRAGCGLPPRPSIGLPACRPGRMPPSASPLPSRAFPRQTTTLPEGGRLRVRVRVLVRRAMRRVSGSAFMSGRPCGCHGGASRAVLDPLRWRSPHRPALYDLGSGGVRRGRTRRLPTALSLGRRRRKWVVWWTYGYLARSPPSPEGGGTPRTGLPARALGWPTLTGCTA